MVGGVAGLIVPAALWTWTMITGELFGLFQLALWPSSIILMATEDPAIKPYAWLYMALSVALNCLWYVFVAGVIYGLVFIGKSLIALAKQSTRMRWSAPVISNLTHIEIKNSVRMATAFTLGIGAAVLSWYFIGQLHSSFMQLTLLGLVPPVASGLIGGVVTAAITPNRKTVSATAAGVILTLPLLAFLLRNGLSHFGRNPFLWYWPVWLVPSFAIGGFLMKGKSKNA